MRWVGQCLLLAVVLCAGLRAGHCLADGWHNAALATGSLDQWLNQNFSDLKSALPNLKEQIKEAEVKSGRDYKELQERANKASGSPATKPKSGLGKAGSIQGKLNPQQQALMGRKSADCLEVLACMNPQNIFPQEFPQFQLEQIPRYREAAKSLLKMMGPQGATAVTSQLRSELMGNSPTANLGLAPHPSYYSDLLEVLRQHIADGTASLEDLDELSKAAAGLKNGPQAKLAQEIQKVLAEIDDVSVLLDWAEQSTDSKRRLQLYGKVRKKLGEATVAQLLRVIKSKADTLTRDAATRELDKRWNIAGPLELMQALDGLSDAAIRKSVIAALAEKSPTYAEVKADLGEIWKLHASSDPAIAAAAREQAANAFVRAPIAECLDWLSQRDAELNKIILEQLDDRIGRADEDRKAGYRDSSLAVASDNAQSTAKRLAALNFLARLKDRSAAGELIELLPLAPAELRPRLGILLRELTGQNFGPKPGDGTAEVSVALKKWREWWKTSGGR